MLDSLPNSPAQVSTPQVVQRLRQRPPSTIAPTISRQSSGRSEAKVTGIRLAINLVIANGVYLQTKFNVI